VRRLPGPADCRLCERVQTLEALLVLFRDWQRTPTQSSVRTLRSLRLQMDVRFCLVQEPPAERHCCATEGSDQSQCTPSGARLQTSRFLLTTRLHGCRQYGSLLAVMSVLPVRTKPQAPRTLRCAILRLYGPGKIAISALHHKVVTAELSASCD
jgi:hypothetical protein